MRKQCLNCRQPLKAHKAQFRTLESCTPTLGRRARKLVRELARIFDLEIGSGYR